jgi:excisionase family DNA binding protein
MTSDSYLMTLAISSRGAKRTQRRAPELEGGGLLSIETAARRLGVAAVTLRNWIRGGQLPHVRLGRRTLIRPERLVDFIDAHEVRGARNHGP